MAYEKLTDTDVDPGDIWGDDKLGRQPLAERIATLIGTISQPFVITLHGDFGSGKTHFVKRLRAMMAQDGFATVYFSLWENDYLRDPLSCLLGEVSSQLSALLPPQDAKEAVGHARTFATFLARKAFPLIVKSAMRAALSKLGIDGEDLNEDLKRLGESIGEAAADAALDQTKDLKESAQAVRDALADIQTRLLKAGTYTKKQIVVFVDDLDRCRPEVLMDTLDSIRHLFSVDGYVFVLSADERALQSLTGSIMGEKDMAAEYLRKFIDLQLRLPDPNREQFAKYLIDEFRLGELSFLTDDDDIVTGSQALLKVFADFSKAYGLTLRDMAQCFTLINMCLRTLPRNEPPFVAHTAMLAAMRLNDFQYYEEYCRTNYGALKHGHTLVKPEFASRIGAEAFELGVIENSADLQTRHDDIINARPHQPDLKPAQQLSIRYIYAIKRAVMGLEPRAFSAQSRS